MPTVPRYEQQVSENALPNVRMPTEAPLEAFGAGQGMSNVTRAAQGVLKTAQDIYVEEKRKGDQVAVLGADRELSAWETKRLYDPKTGALNTRGKDSFGIPEQVSADFKKFVGELEAGLSNADQKIAFQRMAGSRGVDIERALTKHVSSEMRSYDDNVTESYLKSERDAASASYMDQERVDMAIERQLGAIADHAKRHGLPNEWIALKSSETLSKTHFDVTARYLANGQDLAAKKYFDTHKEEFTGADATSLEKALEEGSVRGESQRTTDKIMASGKTRAESMSEARKVSDPKVREATEQLVARRFEEKAAEQRALQADLYLQSTNMLEQPGNENKRPRDVIPPTTWQQLSLEQRNALESRGTDPVNDDKAWLDFLELSAAQVGNLNRADFEAKYWAKFDSSHRTRAESMWDAAKKEHSKDPVLTQALTFKDRVDSTLSTSGLIPASKEKSKYSESEARLYAQFEQTAAAAVEDFEVTSLAGKRKATGKEIQEILDGLVVKKVFVDKWGPDKEKLAMFLTEDEKGASYVPIDKVPPKEKNAIENILRSKGKRISKSKVERAYGAVLTGDRKRLDSILAE